MAAAIWGLADCIIQNMCTVLCSTLFPGRMEAFAMNRFIQAISVAVIMTIEILLEEQTRMIFILVIATCEIVANIAINKVGVKKEK